MQYTMYSIYFLRMIVVAQSLSHVWLFVAPQTAACQASLSFTVSQSLLKLMSIESLMLSNHLILLPSSLFCLQSFPDLSQNQGLFPISWLFTSGGQSIGASASVSVLPINIQGWFPLRLTDLISLLSKGLSQWESSPVPKSKSLGSLVVSLLYGPNLTSVHNCEKTHSFD